MPEITARLSNALADRYKIKIECHLGKGGMANVYLAEYLNPTALSIPNWI